jgi:hypothetical protein
VLLLVLLACAPPTDGDLPADTGVGDEVPVPVSALAGTPYAARVRVGPVVVASPVTRDRVRFYVADPETGDGLEVRLGGRLADDVPPVGTLVTVGLVWVGPDSAPAGWIAAASDVVVEGGPVDPRVADAPESPVPYTLARWPDVRVTAQADPSGRARTSLGRPLVAAFAGPLPDVGNRGAVTGIVLPDGGVAPRFESDWEGPRVEAERIEGLLGDLIDGAYPEGVRVRVAGTQATPWSRDLRRAVLQDELGRGLWIDSEAFGERTTVPRDSGLWWVVPQRDALGWSARLASDPELGERRDLVVRALVPGEPLPERGTLVEGDVTGVGDVGPDGTRAVAEGFVLDDGFVELAGLGSTASVRGVVVEPGRVAVTRVVE